MTLPFDRILELRGLRQQIRALTLDIHTIHTIDFREAIGVGREIFRLTAACKKAGDLIKDKVREECGLKESGQYTFDGVYRSTCTITFRDPDYVLQDALSWYPIRDQIGEDLFYTLFSKHLVITPRKDFQETLATLTPEHQQIVMAAMDSRTHTPRVSFGRKD